MMGNMTTSDNATTSGNSTTMMPQIMTGDNTTSSSNMTGSANTTTSSNMTGTTSNETSTASELEPPYVAAGDWSLEVQDGSVSSFEATFTMVHIDGTERHTH